MLRLFFGVVVTAGWLAGSAPAGALPLFANEYGLSCQKCHSVVPHLSDFGEAFEANGFRLPGGVRLRKAVPVSVKINLSYSSEPDGGGLPKAVVDEIELLAGGTIGARAQYFAESYVVDGGRPGALRDAWIGWSLTPAGSRVPLRLLAGQFTLPLPLDPETFRESARHYAVFDQTVGTNGFNFFDPKTGVSLRAGSQLRGTQVEFAALQGHERQSGLPRRGIDTMAVVHHALGPFGVSAYRYAGTRGDAAGRDGFARTGFGLSYKGERWRSDTLLQTGTDANADGAGTPFASSGGFSQLRYEFNRKLFALARYEGTQDTGGFSRSLTAALGYRVARNTRFTIEDTLSHVPAAKHMLTAQYLIGY